MSDKPVRLLSYNDDTPQEHRGSLIPKSPAMRKRRVVVARRLVDERTKTLGGAVMSLMAVGVLLVLGTTGYGAFSQTELLAAPVVSLVDPYTNEATALEYGPQIALGKKNFFTETRDAFIEEGFTFVEVDMTQKQLRFFNRGVLEQSAEILRVAEQGSWWDTPSGLYKIEDKAARSFTTLGQVYLPWSLSFEGNFMIHGWPSYPDGSEVTIDFTGGGIRLSNESAQALFTSVRVGTPVLVHAAPKTKDVFVYQSKVPEINTPHYFIADIENGTVLAATDLQDQAPIASLTKLMTAVIAAERIDLDGRIQITSPTFVTSLIPRLADRSSVSVYSLLQLLLVESSNEAAETIAGETGREEFINAMNAKARQLGMLQTNFADPSGLSPENVSSVGDLHKLTKYIYENRKFIFEISAKKELATANRGGEFDGLVNFNQIQDLDNFVGGKVGETTAAGQTSITLHTLNFNGRERTVVVILLGSQGRTADVKALLEYVTNRFGG